jgi:GTP-binding protein
MSHLFREYAPFQGRDGRPQRGVMVSMEPGISTAYALNNIQARGRLFIGPQEEIYSGMVVGRKRPPGRSAGNPCKAKAPDEHAQPGRRQRASSWRRRSR